MVNFGFVYHLLRFDGAKEEMKLVQSTATTVDQYLNELPPDRRETVAAVRDLILENLPEGYEETMYFGMIGYVVPLEVQPETYNGQPLEYVALASQKNYISLYLMNVYGHKETQEWFLKAYKASGKKLNMGKSCVRFKKLDDLPLDVIARVVGLTPMDEFVKAYRALRRKK